MPYLTQLAKVARRTGYPVTEIKGWESRGHGPQPSVQGVVCHHTAGATGGGDYPSLAVVRDGRAGLSGPLSHFGLGRSGRIYVIAAGRCWHNAPSTSAQHTNSASIGIEAENNGRQAWPAVQLDAYRRLCAELCKEFGLSASRVKAHREVNRGKPDPHSIDMGDFRADVARLMTGTYEEDDVSAGELWGHKIAVPEYAKDLHKAEAYPAGGWLRGTEVQARRARIAAEANGAAIAELAAALGKLAADRGQTVDVDGLVARIGERIEAISVRLDVEDAS